jgi:glycosyltransferase involved in cell wall biosynthesis
MGKLLEEQNESPLITVVIPVYNAGRFITQTIESVINQTYKNLEILISDNCSEDDSLEIINDFARRDKRIKVLTSSYNAGLCSNFNKLFDHVKSEFIAFFTADDVMLPEKLSRQFDVLKKYPEVAVVHHNAWFIDENSNRIGEHLNGARPPLNPLDWALPIDWLHCRGMTSIIPPSCLARTDYYLKARYDERLKYKHELLFTIEDYCFSPEKKWYYITEPLMLYRYHNSNFTSNPEYGRYLEQEKEQLIDMGMEKCPALTKMFREHRLFNYYKAIVFKQYNAVFEEKRIKQYYQQHSSFLQKTILLLGQGLQALRIYWLVSKMLYFFFKRVYLFRNRKYIQ